MEIGPLDLAKSQVLSARRDTGAKSPIPLSSIAPSVKSLLDTIQADLYTKAKSKYDERLKVVEKWEEVVPALDDKCIVVLPWCEREVCEDEIKEKSARA